MFERFSEWGNQLAKIFGDRTQFGVNTNSQSIPVIEDSLDYHSLNQLLHFDGYNPSTDIFYNKKSQGFILEAYPLLGANEELVNILTSLVTDVLPFNTDLQFILWGSPKIGGILDRFEQVRSGNGEVYEWLAKKRTDFLKKGAFKSLSKQGSFMLRDMRLFIAVSQSTGKGQDLTDKLIALRDDIVSSLKSIQMPTMNLPINEFIGVIADLLHPSSDVYPTISEWNSYDSLSQQLCDQEYFIRVYKDKLQFEADEETWEARALSVKEYPKSMAQHDMTNAIGKLFNDSLQIPCPYLKTFSLRLVDHESGLGTEFKTDRKKKSAQHQDSVSRPKMKKEYYDWSFVNERLAEGDRLVKTYFQIVLFAKEKDANFAERKIRDLYRANGWRLKKTLYLQLQSYLAMLPMMMSEGLYSDMKLFGRLHTMTAFNAMNLAPLQGEWKGTKTPSSLFPGRRGQIATWNAFDNTEGNYNIAIAAAPGKGKSVLAQENIVAGLSMGDFIAAIDNGRSYEKTCKMLKGTYIEFNENTQISLNPFTFIKDFNASLTLLKPLLAAMAHPTTRASDEEIAYLEKAAKAAWEEEGNEASITTISNWLSKHESDMCKNLAHLLYSYTHDGMYAKFFRGRSNIDLDNQFVVLELQELKSKKDLERIILLLLMYQISEKMYIGRRDQKKQCIIDEAWDLFGGENEGSAKFIETGFRTARKYNANFTTVVQSYSDYYKNAATISCLENSDIKIILGQSPETIDQLKRLERLPMDAYTERLFKSLKKTDDFSECIIKMPSGLSVHRIVLDPYSRILYSSKAEEFDAVLQLQKQGKTLKEAIEIVARKFHHED